jgi:hypothetical protein
MAGQSPAIAFLEEECRLQSSGSTLTIEAPWFDPTQSTGCGPVSSRNTRPAVFAGADATAASWATIQGGVLLPQNRAKHSKNGTARNGWQP